MTFAQWFWRTFLLLAGVLAAFVVCLAALVAVRHPGAIPARELWSAGTLAIGVGGLTAWILVRRMSWPLAQLSQHLRSTAASGKEVSRTMLLEQDEIGVIAGAIDQMQRDLAGKLREVQDQRERLESVLSNMAEGVLAAAPDSTILLANDAARQLLDIATPHPLGRSLLEVTRARPVSEALKRALESASAVELEFEPPGVPRRTLSLRATRLPGNPCPGVLFVLHDRTELRRLENLRRELIANVSHELKTPLAAIKGYAETLRLGAVNDPEHNLLFLRRIEEQSDRLHELILDMLQLARLESGEQALDIVELNVRELLDRCLDQFAATAATKRISISLLPVAADLIVPADEEALQTIVNNLIDNAIKYTPAGGSVVVRTSHSPGTIGIEVEDTGIGIAAAELTRIFERFYRVDKARSRELGGTGLGLSIVKHLAQAHGGAVSVVSTPGQGSTFRVELPRTMAAAKHRRARPAAAVSD